MSKKTKARIGIILLTIISFIGTSYALWLFNGTQEEISVIGTKCFKLTMLNETQGIQIEKAIPTSDEEGMKHAGYSFTIKNVCNTNAAYQVNLEELVLEEKRLPDNYIRVSLNSSNGKNLNTYEKVKETIKEADISHKLTSGSLKPEEEITYNLKLWLDEETPASEEVISSTFKSKVSIVATYKEDTENEIEIIVESENKEFQKEEETFLITATSKEYNFIEVSEDGIIFNPIEPTKEYQIKKTYQKEGIYKFYIKDEMGNVKEETIETTLLDQNPPEIEVIEESSNENGASLKIKLKDEKSGLKEYQITETRDTPTTWKDITGKEQELVLEVTENKMYYLWAKDTAGNLKTIAYSVTKVDTAPPTLNVTNELTTWGKKDKIIWSATDDFAGISGYSISKIEGEYNWIVIENNPLEYHMEREVEENGIYYVSVKDAHDHITTKSITIDKIDREGPNITNVSPSTNWSATNEITLEATDEKSKIVGYNITKTEEPPTNWIPTTKLEEENMSTKFAYGTSWGRIFYHDSKGVTNLFQNEEEVLNSNNETKYSVLSKLENFQTKENNYEFLLEYPTLSKTLYNRWIQSANPVTTIIENGTGEETAPGYSEIHIDWNGNYWGGLTKSTNNATFINGSVGHANWFYAIGSYNKYNGGIPGPITSAVTMVELWVRIEDVEQTSKEQIKVKIGGLKENGTYYVWVKDALGNTSKRTVVVNKKDETTPDISSLTVDSTWNTKNTITAKVQDRESGLVGIAWSTSSEIPENFTEVNITKEEQTFTQDVTTNETYYFHAKDNAGNITTKSIRIEKVDKTSPTITSVTGNATDWTKGNVTLTINGAMDEGVGLHATPYSFDNGASWQSGNSKAFTGNTNNIIIKVRDALGNTYTHGAINITKIDKNIPTQSFSIASQTAGSNNWYKALSIKVSGSDVGSGLQSAKYCTTTGSSCTPGTAAALNSNTFNVTLGTNASAQKVCVNFTDKVGNTSTTTCSGTFLVDKNAPTQSFSVASSTAGSNNWYKALSIKVTGSDVGSGIKSAKYCTTTSSTCTPGTAATVSSNAFTVALGTNASAQKVCANFTDKTGNTSTTTCSSAYSVDKNAPTQSFSVASSTAGSNGWYKALSIKVTGSDVGSGIQSAKYCTTTASTCTPGTAATVSSNAFTVTLGTNASSQKVCANFTDKTGNTSTTTCSSAYSVDTSNPTAKITATAKQNNITISASGSSDSGSGIATYYYSKDDGVTWQSSTSASYTFTNLSVTTHKLALKITDKSGRTSSVVKASATIAADVTIFSSGTANYTYQTSNPCGTAPRIQGSSFYFADQCNKDVIFKTAFNNNYRYLKVTATATKSSTYGTYHVARFGIKTDLNSSEGIPSNCIKNHYIISSTSSSNVTSYTTFTLDLGAVTQNSYYVYLHNCDTFYRVQKVWLTNAA